MASGVADPREARPAPAGDLDQLCEHGGGTHPKPALAVQGLVNDQRLERLRVPCDAGHQVFHPLVMTVPARAGIVR